MKNIILALLLILTFSCSDNDKTDQQLLEEDKKELEESLFTRKVTAYKFAKIFIRSSVEKGASPSEFQSFEADFGEVFQKVVPNDADDSESFSISDYISIYRGYKQIEGFIMEMDEDVYPTLMDVFSVMYGGGINRKREYLKGEEKIDIQNIEHAFLSAFAILSKGLGEEIALYECHKINPKLLPDSELKTLLQFNRGIMFFEKGLYYLSEDEISRNIDWLNNNREVDLSDTRSIFQSSNLSNEQTHIGFHALNHLFRALDRLMMEREIDEKRALEDFDIFLKDSKEMGVENEIVWSVETYLHLKKEESEKAIIALTKLKTSELLSSEDKERIDESIEYLKDRKSGKVLNGLYDKYFLGKIATKYMLSILSKIDWKKIMKEENVPYTDEIFETLDNVEVFIEDLEHYSNTEGLKEAGEDIKNETKNLWNKAKGLVE